MAPVCIALLLRAANADPLLGTGPGKQPIALNDSVNIADSDTFSQAQDSVSVNRPQYVEKASADFLSGTGPGMHSHSYENLFEHC